MAGGQQVMHACEGKNRFPSAVVNIPWGHSCGRPAFMKSSEWLIVDTETDGLMDPIHVVEIAAQRMRGWEPVGERFRVLLNHDVPIPSAAVAIHGYTEGFLRQNGEEPLRAHAKFREF